MIVDQSHYKIEYSQDPTTKRLKITAPANHYNQRQAFLRIEKETEGAFFEGNLRREFKISLGLLWGGFEVFMRIDHTSDTHLVLKVSEENLKKPFQPPPDDAYDFAAWIHQLRKQHTSVPGELILVPQQENRTLFVSGHEEYHEKYSDKQRPRTRHNTSGKI